MSSDTLPEDQLSQNEYKTVKFYSPLKIGTKGTIPTETIKKRYPYKSMKPCISFNTVPVVNTNSKRIDRRYKQDFPGVQFPTDYTMEEYYDNESGYVGDNSQYNLHNQYLLNNLNSASTHLSSRQPSPTRFPSSNGSNDKINSSKRQQSHKSIQLTEMFKIANNGKIVREDYPTRPTIQNNSLVLNNTTSNWDKIWSLRKLQIDNRTLHKEKFFKYPDCLFIEHTPNISVLEDMDSDGFTPLSKNQKRKIKIINEKKGYPNLPRTILCRIDGRKHTWVGLDWLFTKCIKNTDHIIVVTNLPSLTRRQKHISLHSATRSRSIGMSRSRSRGRRRSALRGDTDTETDCWTDYSDDDGNSVDTHDGDDRYELPDGETADSWYPGYDINQVRETMKNIQIYIESLLLLNNPQKSIKLTIEITVGKTINCLCNTTNIYTPDLIVATNLNVETTVKWKSNYISDKLCSSFPIPVIMVPTLYMNSFEKSIELKSQQLMTIPGLDQTPIITMKPPTKIEPPVTGLELLQQLDVITQQSLKESIKLNKITSHSKKKQMVDVTLEVPQKKKSSKRKSTRTSKNVSLSPISSDTETSLRKIKTSDPRRLKPIKSNSYSVAEHADDGIPLYKSKSTIERVPLKHFKSNSEIPRKHISTTSSTSTANKGFFSSLFKFGSASTATKDNNKVIFW